MPATRSAGPVGDEPPDPTPSRLRRAARSTLDAILQVVSPHASPSAQADVQADGGEGVPHAAVEEHGPRISDRVRARRAAADVAAAIAASEVAGQDPVALASSSAQVDVQADGGGTDEPVFEGQRGQHRAVDDDVLSVRSSQSVQLPPHIVERDERLSQADLWNARGLFDDAGFESLRAIKSFEIELVIAALEEAHGRPLGIVRVRHVRALHADLCTDSPSDSPQEPNAPGQMASTAAVVNQPPAEEPTQAETSAPPLSNKQRKKAARQAAAREAAAQATAAKEALEAAKAAAAAQRVREADAKAEAERTARSTLRTPLPVQTRVPLRTEQSFPGPSSSAAQAVGRHEETDEEFEDPDADDSDDERATQEQMPAAFKGLSHLETCWSAITADDRAKGPSNLVTTALASISVPMISSDVDLQAEGLNDIFERCHLLGFSFNGLSSAREVRMALRAAWPNVVLEEARAAANAAASARGQGIPSTTTGSSSQSNELHQMSLGAAAAAGAAAADNLRDETTEESTSRKRVVRVVNDARACDSLLEALKAGDAANSTETEADWTKFLDLTTAAQEQYESVADLIHTKAIKTSGTQGQGRGVSLLPGETHAQCQERCAQIARAAVKVAQYARTAINTVELQMTLKRGNGKRLVEAIWYGQLAAEGSSTGSFRMSELDLAKPLASLTGKNSGVTAEKWLTDTLDSIKLAAKYAHPRDRGFERAIVRASATSSGLKGAKTYHDVVFGEMLTRWSTAWNEWQGGTGTQMPLLASSFTSASRDDAVQYVLSGNAERDARLDEQEARTAKAEKESAEAKRELAEVKRLAAATKPKREPSDTRGTRLTLGTVHDETGKAGGKKEDSASELEFVVRGKKRGALRRTLMTKKKALEEAREAAKAATDAKAENAAQLTADVVVLQKEIESIASTLAEQKSES